MLIGRIDALTCSLRRHDGDSEAVRPGRMPVQWEWTAFGGEKAHQRLALQARAVVVCSALRHVMWRWLWSAAPPASGCRG